MWLQTTLLSAKRHLEGPVAQVLNSWLPLYRA